MFPCLVWSQSILLCMLSLQSGVHLAVIFTAKDQYTYIVKNLSLFCEARMCSKHRLPDGRVMVLQGRHMKAAAQRMPWHKPTPATVTQTPDQGQPTEGRPMSIHSGVLKAEVPTVYQSDDGARCLLSCGTNRAPKMRNRTRSKCVRQMRRRKRLSRVFASLGVRAPVSCHAGRW